MDMSPSSVLLSVILASLLLTYASAGSANATDATTIADTASLSLANVTESTNMSDVISLTLANLTESTNMSDVISLELANVTESTNMSDVISLAPTNETENTNLSYSRYVGPTNVPEPTAMPDNISLVPTNETDSATVVETDSPVNISNPAAGKSMPEDTLTPEVEPVKVADIVTTTKAPSLERTVLTNAEDYVKTGLRLAIISWIQNIINWLITGWF